MAKAIPTHSADWITGVDDDLAVLPIAPGESFEFNTIPVDEFITESDVSEATFVRLERHDLAWVMTLDSIGRLITHDGKQRNKPVVRFGSLSALADANERVQLDALPPQEAFLVECRSLSGFSGSPVPLYQNDILASGAFTRVGDGRGVHRLLGVDCGHIPLWQSVFENKFRTKLRVESNTGIAVVIPAWRLLRLLNEDYLLTERNRRDRAFQAQAKGETTAVLDVDGLTARIPQWITTIPFPASRPSTARGVSNTSSVGAAHR